MFHKFLIAILIFISGLFLLAEKKRFEQTQNAKNHQVYSLISKNDRGHVIVGNYYVDEQGEVVWLQAHKFLSMLHILRPSVKKMPALIQKWRNKPLTYQEIGCTRLEKIPPGYNKDKHRVLLGSGEETFIAAKNAVQNWKMYDLGWMDVHRPLVPIKEGEVSVTFIKLFGIWFGAIPCRIVYTINESNSEKSLFGFAFGTIEDHPEIGEEKFAIEWDHSSNNVYYEVCAISRSGHFLTKCGYPVMRYLQKRFFRDTLQSILRNSKVSDIQLQTHQGVIRPSKETTIASIKNLR